MPTATLELSNPAQIALIDDVEVGRPGRAGVPAQHPGRLRGDRSEGVTKRLTAAGAELVAPPTETPWRSLNSRMEAPGGLQITAYQELETLEERAQKPGFGKDGDR